MFISENEIKIGKNNLDWEEKREFSLGEVRISSEIAVRMTGFSKNPIAICFLSEPASYFKIKSSKVLFEISNLKIKISFITPNTPAVCGVSAEIKAPSSFFEEENEAMCDCEEENIISKEVYFSAVRSILNGIQPFKFENRFGSLVLKTNERQVENKSFILSFDVHFEETKEK